MLERNAGVATAHHGRPSACAAQQPHLFFWAIVDTLSNRYASAIVRAGVVAGDRVALLSRNSDQFLPIVTAISRIGAIAVPMNYRLSATEITAILSDSGARIVVIEEREHQRLSAAGWVAPCPTMIAGRLGKDASPPPTYSCQPDDIVLQMYTSGTSGRPKGVMISHAALLTNAHQLEVAISYRLSRGDRYLLVCPMCASALPRQAMSPIQCRWVRG